MEMSTESTMTKTAETGEPSSGGKSNAAYPDYMTLRRRVEEFLDTTLESRSVSERCRDYVDGRQWTPQQVQELKRRKQAPIVNNRIKTKQNGLMGLAGLNKTEPKAFPRNAPNDDGAADACTDGMRYAAEKADLQVILAQVYGNYFCEGYGGVDIRVETNSRKEVDVTVDHIPWDRIFFDPFSRKHDFTDGRDRGYIMWMDEEDIEETFPDAEANALTISEEVDGGGDTFDDKPSWYISRGMRKRHMVATHYFKWKGVWCLAIYAGGGFLLSPQPSPYLDENEEPCCTLEFVSAYTDRYNYRYGELVSSLDLQDEINHRRSKALFLLSQRQTYGNRGAVKDIKKAKRELAKADGHLEVGQGEYGKDFGVLPTGDMAEGQFQLLQEAKAEIDAQSYNAQMAGQRQSGDISGVAIGKLQQAGVMELNMLLDQLTNFRLRVYRQMWWRIRQFWDQEKWVRVTDDEQAPRWVGFNVQVLMGDFLKETMNDESKPIAMRAGAAAKIQELGQTNPQALQQPMMTKNEPAKLDMDIILDESYNVLNTSAEQLDTIMKMGAAGQFDICDLLEISNLPGKGKLIKKIKERQASQQQSPEMRLANAKIAEIQAKTQAIGQPDQLEKMKLQNEQLKMQIDQQKLMIESQNAKTDALSAETERYEAVNEAKLRYMELTQTHEHNMKVAATAEKAASAAAAPAPAPAAREAAPQAPAAAPISIVLSRDGVSGVMDQDQKAAADLKTAEFKHTDKVAGAIIQAIQQQTNATLELTAAVKAPKTGKITKDTNGTKTVEVK